MRGLFVLIVLFVIVVGDAVSETQTKKEIEVEMDRVRNLTIPEFIEYSMEWRGVEKGDLYGLLHRRIYEEIEGKNVPYSKAYIDLLRTVENGGINPAEIESEALKQISVPEEIRKIALVLLIKNSYPHMVESVVFPKNSGAIRDYIYNRWPEGAEPRDKDVWEQVIFRSCVSEVEKVYKTYIETGQMNTSTPYLYAGWLGKYGESPEVKQFLLDLPFHRYSMVYLLKDKKFSSRKMRRLEIGGDDTAFLGWYCREVLKPAGLEDHFIREAEDMRKYLQSCINELQGSGS